MVRWIDGYHVTSKSICFPNETSRRDIGLELVSLKTSAVRHSPLHQGNEFIRVSIGMLAQVLDMLRVRKSNKFNINSAIQPAVDNALIDLGAGHLIGARVKV